MVRIEIATDYNAFNAGYRRSDHVPHVRQELSNCDLTFLNVLSGFRFSIPNRDATRLGLRIYP